MIPNGLFQSQKLKCPDSLTELSNNAATASVADSPAQERTDQSTRGFFISFIRRLDIVVVLNLSCIVTDADIEEPQAGVALYL